MNRLRASVRRLMVSKERSRRVWHALSTCVEEARGTGLAGLRSWLTWPHAKAPLGALNWLRRNELPTGGIRVHSRHRAAYAEVTGYLIPTLLDYGEDGLACRCASWLARIQGPDGSFADPNDGLPFVFDTGQVLRGLLATVDMVPAAAAAARRAAEYLYAKAVDGGKAGFDVRYPNTDPHSTHLYVLPPLRQAAAFFDEPRYREIADACLEYYLARPDALQIATQTHELGYELEALIDLGREDKATPVLEQLSALQGADGSLRGSGSQQAVCTPGLAQIAVCWYKLRDRRPADKALVWLERHQLRCGGFFGSYGPGANYFPEVVPAWAVKFYLDAHRLRTTLAGQAR